MRVNGIGPGLIQTVLREYYRKAADRTEKLIRQQPYNTREPAEIAEVALLLAGDRASYLTGQTIVVDGGASL